MADKKEYCSPCLKLREQSAEFIQHGVSEAVCNSLMQNTGFVPANGHKDCEDLHDADNCLIKGTIDKLPAYDTCDWKEFMDMFGRNQYNINEAIICALCGAWNKIEKLESIVNSLAFSNLRLETRAIITLQDSPEGTLSIDRQGNFTYTSVDYLDTAHKNPYGNKKLTGKLNFCMGMRDNGKAFYRIKSVYLNTYQYTVTNADGALTKPKIIIKVPNSSGTVVYEKTDDKTRTDKIDKTIAFSKEADLNNGGNSGWITFIDIYSDWVYDNDIHGDIRFLNNNLASVPICTD